MQAGNLRRNLALSLTRFRVVALLRIATWIAALLLPSVAFAQTVRGRVVMSEKLGAVAGATVELLDSAAVSRGRAVTDRDGNFEIRARRAGSYVLQASQGRRLSAPSSFLELGLGEEIGDIFLILPTPLEALASTCPAGGAGAGAALVGVIYGRGSEVAIPGAWITLRWGGGEGGNSTEERISRGDAAGLYRFCNVPVRTLLTAEIEALGSKRGTVQLELPPGPMARADLEVELGLGESVLELLSSTTRPDLGSESAVVGRLIDASSGDPISGVVITVGKQMALSSRDGEFGLTPIKSGNQVIELEHVAYGKRHEVVELVAGEESVVKITLTPQPIALNEVVVEARQERDFSGAMVSLGPRRILVGKEMVEARNRGDRVGDVLRRFPGLSVGEGTYSTVDGVYSGVCITSNRRIARLRPPPGDSRDTPFCEMLPVILDGIRITAAVDFLRNLALDDIESVEYVSALDAGIQFGLEAAGAGGAIVIWTRRGGRP
jgi:hypothetical protein